MAIHLAVTPEQLDAIEEWGYDNGAIGTSEAVRMMIAKLTKVKP